MFVSYIYILCLVYCNTLFLPNFVVFYNNITVWGQFLGLVRLLLVESLVIVIFYVIFLMRYAVIINY